MQPNRTSYTLDVVIPCYHEEDALPLTLPRILDFLRSLNACANGLSAFRLILVDDGSRDATWDIVSRFAQKHAEIVGIKLARNYGHQAAMLAGLAAVEADISITMDADLQDDIEAIKPMLQAYEAGSDLALGVRIDRSADTWLKRTTANSYYRALSLFGLNVIENHADFRLMSRRALAALLQYQESNLYLRGLIPTLGFAVATIPYVRKAREAGETKYTVAKMLGLATDGITSFSVTPLRMIAVLGALVFSGAMLAGAFFLAERVFHPESTTPGWASTVLPLLFLGGLQIFCTGIIGEYIGKIYLEVKRRPRFVVEEVV